MFAFVVERGVFCRDELKRDVEIFVKIASVILMCKCAFSCGGGFQNMAPTKHK